VITAAAGPISTLRTRILWPSRRRVRREVRLRGTSRDREHLVTVATRALDREAKDQVARYR